MGKQFSTKSYEHAVFVALQAANQLSAKHGVEYSGWIVKRGDRYSYTTPVGGTSGKVNPGYPTDGEGVAVYHSHLTAKRAGRGTASVISEAAWCFHGFFRGFGPDSRRRWFGRSWLPTPRSSFSVRATA